MPEADDPFSDRRGDVGIVHFSRVLAADAGVDEDDALIGLGIGLVGAYGVGLGMRSTLYGTGAMNLHVAGMVGAVPIATTLAACCVPARRASAVDPMAALRQA